MKTNYDEYVKNFHLFKGTSTEVRGWPGYERGNEIAIALDHDSGLLENLSWVETTFFFPIPGKECPPSGWSMKLTARQFVEHFGHFDTTDDKSQNTIPHMVHVDNLHMKDGKIYTFFEGDGEYTRNRFELTYDPTKNFIDYDVDIAERLRAAI